MKAESGGKLLIFGVSREVYLHEKMKKRRALTYNYL